MAHLLKENNGVQREMGSHSSVVEPSMETGRRGVRRPQTSGGLERGRKVSKYFNADVNSLEVNASYSICFVSDFCSLSGLWF